MFYSFSIAHFVLGSLILHTINEDLRRGNWTISFLGKEFVFKFLGGPDAKRMHNKHVVILPTMLFAMFVVSAQGIGLFLMLCK